MQLCSKEDRTPYLRLTTDLAVVNKSGRFGAAPMGSPSDNDAGPISLRVIAYRQIGRYLFAAS
jgi:hypothetical protein